MKYLIILLLLLSSCTTYPKLEYEAIDNKGKKLTVHEYKGSYEEHQHNIGDTVVIFIHHGAYGQIDDREYDGRRIPSRFKNVIITKKK